MSAPGAPSPGPSQVFAGTALVLIAAVVLLILRHYLPLRTTPAYLLVPVFFALFLPAAMVLLVPIDLASSAQTDDVDARGIWLAKRPLLVSWRITYWLTFALTWFILPILAEYSDSGYRDPQAKVIDSLRANAQYYGLMLGSGVLGFVYVIFYYGHFSDSIKSTVMALAYCWGLVLAIYLMGHGLVALPRRLFRNASIAGRLRHIQSQAPRVYESMEESGMVLDELEGQVFELAKRSKTGSARDFCDWIEDLLDTTNLPEAQPRTGALGAEARARGLPTVITEKYLADLTRRLTRARHARSRYASEWNQLLTDAVQTQAILDSAASKKLDLGMPSPVAGARDKITVFTPYTRYLFHYHAMPMVRFGFGALLASASFCIVWSEIVKGVLPSLSIIRYSMVHHWTGEKGQVGFAGQVIAVLWMMYMCAAALAAITEVKVWRGRALVKRNTAHESAFWYASQIARLSIPLSYNFMTFVGGAYKDTVFYSFLGRLIDLTPLGKWFDYLFPAFILVPICATFFGLYGKVRQLLGFGDLVDDEGGDDGRDGFSATAYGTGSWREGRDLIERELNGQSAAIRRRRAEASGRLSATDSGRNSPVAGGGGNPHRPPVLSVPARPEPRSPITPLATSPNARPLANTSARRVGARNNRAAAADETEPEEGFFESFGHRFKNTMDTLETPKWLKNMKKPKWMEYEAQAGRVLGAGRAVNGDAAAGTRRFGGGGRTRL